MEHDRSDGSIAHRGELYTTDDGGPRPYRPADAPTEQIAGMSEFGRGVTSSSPWRRWMGRLLLGLFALGLLSPFVVVLTFVFS